MLIESIRMSWENIIHNKLRSFLTMLGIVIGVAAIISLITIVQGATRSISDQVSALGVNKITVNIPGTPLKQGLNREDMARIAGLDNILGLSPTISARTSVASGDRLMTAVTIQGRNEVYFQMDEDLLQDGRSINILDVESKNPVAVIGNAVVTGLFYGEDPVGKSLVLNGTTFTVIGTLAPSSMFGITSSNKTVIIPYTTALRSLGGRNVSAMDIFLKDPNLADQTVTDINSVLIPAFNYKEDAFSVYNMGDMVETFRTLMSMMSLLLAGIAAISLVVGGIGIMNMMLVSITERTAEIGLRKALGATPRRIRLQFIIESVFLSLMGGLAGLLLGSLIAYMASMFIGIRFAITLTTVLLAVGFSAAVGILFGTMPARKASRLNPIDALRSL